MAVNPVPCRSTQGGVLAGLHELAEAEEKLAGIKAELADVEQKIAGLAGVAREHQR